MTAGTGDRTHHESFMAPFTNLVSPFLAQPLDLAPLVVMATLAVRVALDMRLVVERNTPLF